METNPSILAEFARDVRVGLGTPGPKQLPPQYLYDTLGSALFEAITHLPEYGLTRADERLIKSAGREIAACIYGPLIVAELGSGSGSKTRELLLAFQPDRLDSYRPIDVSLNALRRCRRELGDVAAVKTFHGGYLDGLRALSEQRPPGVSLLLLFLGSSIGNFDRENAGDFIHRVRGMLKQGDRLLLGADLLKPVDVLLKAYDDPAGVTAAFNLNLLGRMNRELGADFNIRAFEHQARYDTEHSRIEMHLRSKTAQQVHIPGSDIACDFKQDETIRTESSHKFRPQDLKTMAEKTGFKITAEWVDDEWPFVESLWEAV